MCNNCEFFFLSFLPNPRIFNKSTMTCATNWVQYAYLPENTSPPRVRVVIRVHLEFVLFCLVFCWPLFVYMYLLIFFIVFAVLRSTGSNDQFSCTVDCNVKIYTYTKKTGNYMCIIVNYNAKYALKTFSHIVGQDVYIA